MFHPPVREVIDTTPYDIDAHYADRGHDIPVRIPTTEGDQQVPVTVYLPEKNGQPHYRHPAGTVALRSYAWSASNETNFQRARTQLYADIIGMPVIAPNNIGQGEGSPDLTDEQKIQLKAGGSSEVGRVMIEAAVQAYERHYEPIRSMVAFGESLAPSLAPGLTAHLPDHIDLTHQIWILPDGTCPGRSRIEIALREIAEFPALLKYLGKNPEPFRTKPLKQNVNLAKGLWNQWSGHTLYPYLITNGDLVHDFRAACSNRDVKPEIHIVSATKDKLAPHASNLAAADYFNGQGFNTSLTTLEGDTHAAVEHIGLIGLQLASALGVEDIEKITV